MHECEFLIISNSLRPGSRIYHLSKFAFRSVCEVVCGECSHSEEDHQEEDQSLSTWQRALFQWDLQIPPQPNRTLHTGTTGHHETAADWLIWSCSHKILLQFNHFFFANLAGLIIIENEFHVFICRNVWCIGFHVQFTSTAPKWFIAAN